MVPYEDPDMTDAKTVGAEENKITLPETAAPPDPLVATVPSQTELFGSGVRKIGTMVKEGPAREARAVESLR